MGRLGTEAFKRGGCGCLRWIQDSVGHMAGWYHPGCSSKDGALWSGHGLYLSVPEKGENRVETWRGGKGRRLQRGSWAGEEEASLAPC